ncbi:dol-P-Glc:Glc(2)Man(9)GlcNAc(2)-PP-Dol alpha-1,2-glucosyltransferase-like [Branchiostoma lanceolatum]|uniref:dol-P-Glc:Glc(2)Man(9)GlcNAc(2)-PP-Dol alpha-1,2-glucosyltransferase-like n=1 Tax=Branchiostoma lanceolatum TaxID=7740 RepID=UPI003452E37B
MAAVRTFAAVLSVFVVVSVAISARIHRAQPAPYMDEIFHVPQAQKYCQGKFTEWDPMITTLPGLYLASVGLLKPAVLVAGVEVGVACSTLLLRATNILFAVGNVYLLWALLRKIHGENSDPLLQCLNAVTLASLPVLYFFSFLYYTDPGATFFTLFMYLLCCHDNHVLAAAMGFMAVMFRQTNVVWLVFCAGITAVNLVERKHPPKRDPNVLAALADGVRTVLRYLATVSHFAKVTLAVLPYAVQVAAFGVFVYANGGIVVGDRTSHQACLNFPQLFYFLCFSFLFSSPHVLSLSQVSQFLKCDGKKAGLLLCLLALSYVLVDRFTYVHPYLLADNRHYTFYVWQRLFQRHSAVKFALLPAYLYCGWSVFHRLGETRSPLWQLVFFVCVLVATVPQKLLEFRYFIVPYLLYRVHVRVTCYYRLLAELVLYTAVNAVTVYLFVAKPFLWPDSSEQQHFMW